MFAEREQAIRKRAYGKWEEQGRPDGKAVEHWVEAEAEIVSSQMPHETQMPAAQDDITSDLAQASPELDDQRGTSKEVCDVTVVPALLPKPAGVAPPKGQQSVSDAIENELSRLEAGCPQTTRSRFFRLLQTSTRIAKLIIRPEFMTACAATAAALAAFLAVTAAN